MVYQCFGIDYAKAMDLDCLSFAQLERDAIIMRLKETDDGKDYLDKCWALKQTSPDVAALRDAFGKGGES